MSTITLELPDDIAARLTTPEGMARIQTAVFATMILMINPIPEHPVKNLSLRK
jgi:hypothetical protein